MSHPGRSPESRIQPASAPSQRGDHSISPSLQTIRQNSHSWPPSARITTVPNGVDTTYFAPSDGEERGAVFVVGTNWFPNRDALEWFVASVLPVLREKGFEQPVKLVGFVSPEERQRYQGIPGLTLTGYVSELKVLDAWSSGKAVVSTSIGCEGLATRPGENILLADTPGAIADAVMAICRDPELRRKLGREARRTVEEQYAWDVIGEGLRSQYRDIIGQPSSEFSPLSS